MSVWLEFNLDTIVSIKKHISIVLLLRDYCIQLNCETPIITELYSCNTNQYSRSQRFKVAIPNMDSSNALEFLAGLDTTFRKSQISFTIEVERLSIST